MYKKNNNFTKTKINEKKAITIITITFVLIVLIGGYITFKIKDNKKSTALNNYSNKTFIYSSELITLTSNNIMNKEKGLKSGIKNIRIINNTNEDINYRIILKEEDINCTCQEKIPNYYIRYSIDGKTVKSITKDNNEIFRGIIKKLSNKNIKVKIWIDNKYTGEDHFHGVFVVEKVE